MFKSIDSIYTFLASLFFKQPCLVFMKISMITESQNDIHSKMSIYIVDVNCRKYNRWEFVVMETSIETRWYCIIYAVWCKSHRFLHKNKDFVHNTELLNAEFELFFTETSFCCFLILRNDGFESVSDAVGCDVIPFQCTAEPVKSHQ